MSKMATDEQTNIPIHIVYVSDHYSYYDEDILEFCAERGFRFTFRIFDSIEYSDDRQNIQKLPAMHLYIKKTYRTTLYKDHTLFETLDEYHKEYEKNKYKRIENKISLYSLFLKGVKSILVKSKNHGGNDSHTETPIVNPMKASPSIQSRF